MMIETLESREFCSVTPGFVGGVRVAAGDVTGDDPARIVVVQPTSTTPPPSPNVVISIIAILIG